MKKQRKKLALAKETVLELGAPAHVVGAFTNTGCSEEISASCDWTCGCVSRLYACVPGCGTSGSC